MGLKETYTASKGLLQDLDIDSQLQAFAYRPCKLTAELSGRRHPQPPQQRVKLVWGGRGWGFLWEASSFLALILAPLFPLHSQDNSSIWPHSGSRKTKVSLNHHFQPSPPCPVTAAFNSNYYAQTKRVSCFHNGKSSPNPRHGHSPDQQIGKSHGKNRAISNTSRQADWLPGFGAFLWPVPGTAAPEAQAGLSLALQTQPL